MSDVEAPTGFQFGLPEDWEIGDLAEPTIARIGLSDAPFTLATAHWRLGDIERATEGQQVRARWRRMVGGSPAEAECSLAIYATDVDNAPDRLHAVLARATGDTTDTVALPAGTAVRRTGRRPADGERPERFVHQFFIPVPGTANEITFLEFWSPTFAAEGFFRPHFEGIASSFEFSYQDPEVVIVEGDDQGVEPDIQMGPLIRSAFTGWPRRFTVLGHLAVATWMAAALVIAGRVFADADKGLGAIVDDLSSGAFLAFFAPVGYLVDQAHDRGMRLGWLVLGLFMLWVAITCPEGRLGYLC